MRKNMVGKGWFWVLRMVLMIVAVFCFLWFALPLTLSVSLNIGNLTGLAVSVLLFFYGLFMPWVHGILAKWRKHKVLRFLHWGILGIIALIALLVVIESTCMIVAANKEPEPGATVVVLGCRVYGERASLSMVERLDAAYEYLTEHPESKCVLSGGKGDGDCEHGGDVRPQHGGKGHRLGAKYGELCGADVYGGAVLPGYDIFDFVCGEADRKRVKKK